ncbi:unnamed protein product [Clavelina lepadiformis]|uniref:Uncharacterized protein n=1 Tax=Clavelina lepadiformis TaxID=159417 RepID=A0ABP0GQQ1_CLALP
MRRVCSKPKLRAVVVVLVIITWLIIYRTLKCSVDFYQWKNIHTVYVDPNEFRRGFTGNEKDSDYLKATMGHISYLPILSSSPPTSDWMSCDDIKELLQEMRNGHTTFFNHSLHENGDAANFVIKQSTIFNVTSEDDVYRYNSVVKEIENLKRLHSLGWRGIPILYGACVTESLAVYVTSKLRGLPLCDGSGVSLECAAGEEMRRSVEKLENRSQASLMWMSKVKLSLLL